MTRLEKVRNLLSGNVYGNNVSEIAEILDVDIDEGLTKSEVVNLLRPLSPRDFRAQQARRSKKGFGPNNVLAAVS